jgi:hypothetical protein
VVLTHEMPRMLFVVPEVCAAQVVPPLVVAVITPLLPTAQHDVVLTQVTWLRVCATFEFCEVQVEPPSVVLAT